MTFEEVINEVYFNDNSGRSFKYRAGLERMVTRVQNKCEEEGFSVDKDKVREYLIQQERENPEILDRAKKKAKSFGDWSKKGKSKGRAYLAAVTVNITVAHFKKEHEKH
jgi:hypothetical protein